MKLPEFSAYEPAVLRSARPAAEEQAWIELSPPPGFAESHTRAGQFCRIRAEGHEGIFAMCTAPGEPGARFLVRVGTPEGGEAADALARLDDGAPVEMSLPAGQGFALERARGLDLLFVATGTGVAPVRAAIESVLQDRASFGHLSFEHGVRSSAHLAIADDLARWRAAGVDVHVRLSSPSPAGDLRGVTVQDAILATRPSLARTAVIAVGQPEMLAALEAAFLGRGGARERFLTNL
jgi:NAD(P)H-flavin reductase